MGAVSVAQAAIFMGLLSLIGLVAVMVIQDPVMSLFAFVIAFLLQGKIG